jgi:hypothetical protein
MMPQLVTVSIRDPQRRPIRLWFPIVPILLVLSPVLVLAFVVGTVAGLRYRVNPVLAFVRGWRLLCATRGTLIDVEQGRRTVYVAIS